MKERKHVTIRVEGKAEYDREKAYDHKAEGRGKYEREKAMTIRVEGENRE